MYEIFKNILNERDYELVDILNKIDEYYVESKLSKEQKEELEEEARQNANPENSYAPLEERLDEAFERIKVLEEKVTNLDGEAKEDDPEEEWPEYVQPTGAHDAYHIGDKITFEGKHYECIKDNCVWDPKAYKDGWKLIEESE